MSSSYRRVGVALAGALGLIVLVALVVGFLGFGGTGNSTGAPTAQPTQAPNLTLTLVTPAAQRSADATTPTLPEPTQATDTPLPTPTPYTGPYTVLEGDTLWAIALKFGLSLDQLLAANPNLNPDLIQPGQVVQVPLAGAISPITPISTGQDVTTPMTATLGFQPNAQVKPDADRLRLRAQPSSTSAVLRQLEAQTPLQVSRRTSDGAWLQVTLADGQSGWVMAQFVGGALDTALPTVIVTPLPPTPTALTQLEARPGAAVAALPVASLPRPEPYLQNFTTRASDIYRAGLRMGNQPNVFTLVGDSNTANPAFFEAFDVGNYNLDQYGYLEETLRYYKGHFKLTSVAAVGGFNTTRLWEPERANPARCQPGEGSLACEYRIKKPSVALILIGSNDRPLWREFEDNYRQIIEYTIRHGIVPVLITKADDTETQYGGPSGHINAVIRKLSSEYAVPLLDLRQAIDQFQLPNNGLEADNLHYNTPPDSLSAHFNPEHLRFGYTVRNLTALQALDAVRRLVIE